MTHTRPPRSDLALFVTTALLATSSALGCAGSEVGPPATAGSSSSVPIPEGATRPPPQPVELLAEGGSPSRPLRFAYANGARGRAVFEMDMAVGVRIGGGPMNEPEVPTMRFEVTLGPVTTYADGTSKLPYHYESIAYAFKEEGGDPAMLAALEEALRPMQGMRGEVGLDPRGTAIYVRNEVPAEMDPQMQDTLRQIEQAMTQILPPLPADPVGVGARWTTRSKIDTERIDFFQTTTYTLRAMDADTITLDVATEQEAPAQDVPGVAGAQMTLTRFAGSGSGHNTVSLTTLEQSAELSYANDAAMSARAEGRELAMELRMGFTLRIAMSPLL